MPTIVSRLTDTRLLISLCCAVCLLVCAVEAQAARQPAKSKPGSVTAKKKLSSSSKKSESGKTGSSAAAKEWGPYLDVAYELTYWEKPEIREWREKRDQELGQSLAAFIATWTATLTPDQEMAETPQTKGLLPTHGEREYLRLGVAFIIDYLQSDNIESINNAVKTLDHLKGKISMPEIAFWFGYAKSLRALEVGDSQEFTAQVYNIWNNAILYIEQNELTRNAADKNLPTTTPYYYRNLINLVVDRAIISKKQEKLEALGPLFIMMKDRNLGGEDNEGKYTSTLIQRITDGLTAPDSDRYRLNFTVAMIESKRLQQIANSKLDSEGMTADARKSFEQFRVYNDLALKWAASRRSSGVVAAAADYLDTTSFAIQRLPDNQQAPEYEFFSALPNKESASAILNSMAIFNDIATYSAGGWEKAGYESRELYVKACHRFWRAIMELSLWTGDYYFARINASNDPQTLHAAAAPMQVALDSYIDFLASQLGRGYRDIIPDSAYFGASEAADRLAFSYRKISGYNSDNSAYNLWFSHRLQATELFPFSPLEARQTATALRQDGRYSLYLAYFVPLSTRVKESQAFKKWISEQKADIAPIIRDYANSIERLFAGVPGGMQTVPEVTEEAQFAASFKTLREELQRKPDHPLHKLLRAFYLEELQKTTSFTLLLKDINRLDHGF